MLGSYTTGGFTGALVPQIGFIVQIPEPFVDSRRGVELYKQIAKRVMEAVLSLHHSFTIPMHFQQTNRGRYNHQERTAAYKAIKRRTFGSITDLKKSGRSRDKMMGKLPNVRFPRLDKEVIVGQMQYRWGFPTSRDQKDSRYVTIKKMSDELATWTWDEMTTAIETFRDLFIREWKFELRNRKKFRKVIMPKLAKI